MALAKWLDARGIVWNHIPNEGRRGKIQGGRLKAKGFKKGFPDNAIYTIPPACPEARGVAIELKRRKGSSVPREQRAWLQRLEQQGWLVRLCRGANEAVEWLKELGF